MPAHLIYGDSFLVSQALKEFESQVGPPEVLEANSHRISGAQIELADIRILGNAMPFLAERRLVIVEGLVSLFDSRAGGRRRAASRGKGSSPGSEETSLADWQELPQYIKDEMSPTTLLVFVDGALARGNLLLERLRAVAHVQNLPTPSGEGFARWIRNCVSDKGSSITPGAIRLFVQLVGSNLRAADSEIEKLSLYVKDRAIEEKDVRLLVTQAREASIFSAVDALLAGESATALRLMHRLRDDGAEMPYIVAMIARQLRLVTLARHLIDKGHGIAEIGDRLKLTNDFAIRRAVEQARRHPWSSLEWLYRRLLETDLAVKRGRLDQDMALELLVGEVSGRGASPGQGPR